MARSINRLSARAVAALTAKGYYPDGGGLYLQISAAGTKSWIFRFMLAGRAREMGLGPLNTVSLAEARAEAERCRKLARDAIDPIEARAAERAKRLAEMARTMTFKQCAEAYIRAHEAGWKNAKHAAQWTSTMETYAYPVLGKLPVGSVDTALVMKVLEPIWTEKTETASRVRGRMESILGWATVSGFRSGDNPARWKGHLQNLLPARSKVQKVEHHAALPYDQMGAFMVALRAQEGIGARGLEFCILTATRTIETIGARWDEFDIAKRVWTIPGDRMKAGLEHRVPLSDAAMAVLTAMGAIRVNEFVFPGAGKERPLSNMAFLQLLKRMKRSDLTAHGFRSTFRDWAAERTNFPNEVAEKALAHVVKNKVEAAYRRGDLLEKRVPMMKAWADFCAKVPAASAGNVVAIKGE